MSTSKALDGLRPYRKKGAGANTNGTNIYPIASGYAANIFTGDLVKTSVGVTHVYAAVTDKPIGVFAGVKYDKDGSPVWSKYWPTGTSASNIEAYVIDDANQTYAINSDAPVTAGDLNTWAMAVTLGAGSTVTGRSGFGLEPSTRASTGALVPIAIIKEPGNTIGDAFTKVEVRLNNHQTAYVTVALSAT
jgi:hypothetical protein